MKKVLLLLMTIFVSFAAFANEVTYTASNDLSGNEPKTWSPANSLFTFTLNKNNGTSAPAYLSNGKDLRIYAKGSIKIESKNGEKITKVVFNLSSQGEKRLAAITANDGTIATQTKGDASVTWTGENTTITFTVGDKANYGSDGESKAGQLCFSSVTITYEENTADTRQDVTLTWSAATAETTFGATDFAAPTLTVTPEAAASEVVYSSDNESVAIVDATNGNVTIKGIGTAKIKAEIANSETYKSTDATYTLTVVDGREDATISFAETSFTANLGETFTAPTPTVNPTDAVVTYSSSKPEVATVDEATGAVTLVAAGTTTITASIAETATHKAASATYTLKVVDPNAPAAEKFVLVTDASTLVNGQKIIIVSKNNNVALGPQSGSNCPQVEVTKKDNGTTIEPNDNVQIITLESTTTTSGTNCFAFNVGGEYLYAASSSSNHLKTQTTLNDNGKATIEINSTTGVATIKFQGTNTHNLLKYNSSSTLFSCYASGQEDVQIYALPVTYSYTGTISLGEAYSYNEYSKANVLTFTATISKNGHPIDDEKANYEVLLDGVSVGHAGDNFSHFAYNKDGKFSLKNGDRTIALDVEWPDLDAVLPIITGAKYITYSDNADRTDAKYYIKASDDSYNWTVKSTDENAIVGWENNLAFCLYENATPDAINVKITFPFAVTKSTDDNTQRAAVGEGYDIVTYEPANATELSTAEFAKDENNTEVSGVADVAVDQNSAVEYYNLQGVRVNGDLTPGLYIRRQGNQATKVVVR